MLMFHIWLVVKTTVPFWVRHLVFRDPKEDHSFDSHPYGFSAYPRGGLALLHGM